MDSKGERTKKEICRVAAKLFSQRGYKDVSMQDICNATGLSKGGLYRHFSSKAEILLETVKKEKPVEQDIEAGKSAVEILEKLLKIYLEDMVILENVDFVHHTPMTVLPMGALCEINCDNASFTILEPGVRE